MAGVQMRLVDHIEPRRLKRPLQLLTHGRFDGHLHVLYGSYARIAGDMAHVQRSRPHRATPILCTPRLAHILRRAMKLDSKYFDSVRVKPDHEKAVAREAPACQWKGCSAAGVHRAPRGRGHEGEYYLLCLEHVRAVQCLLQLLRGHEQRRHRGLPEGQRHGPPADLEGRRQRVGARHAPRHGAYGQPRPASRPARVFLVALGPGRRRASSGAPSSRWS